MEPVIVIAKLILGIAIGASVGAFAGTAAIRLANGHNPWVGRSQCDGCARQLEAWETVPLISFAVSRGHCRTCHAAIDRLHPLAEMLGALVLSLSLLLHPGLDGILLGAMSLLLLTTALVDLRTLKLLDVFTLPIAALSVWLAWREGHLWAGIIAALASAMLLLGVKYVLERQKGRPVLGLGDIKLIAALALWMGVRTPLMVAMAAGLGLIAVLTAGNRNRRIPFGPMLATAAFLLGIISSSLHDIGLL